MLSMAQGMYIPKLRSVHMRASLTYVRRRLYLQGDVEEMEVEQAGPSTGKAVAKPTTGKRFEIKKWNAVAMWSWAICTDTCAICRNNLYEPSIEYQVCHTHRDFLERCLHANSILIPDEHTVRMQPFR